MIAEENAIIMHNVAREESTLKMEFTAVCSDNQRDLI